MSLRESNEYFKNKHLIFYITEAVLIVLGVIVPMLSLAAFLALVAYLLLFDADDMFLIMLFLMPFACIFKSSASSSSFFTYAQLLLVIKLILKKRAYSAGFLVSWLLLFVYIVAGSNLNILSLIKQGIILPFVYLFFSETHIHPKKFVLNFSFGLILSSFIAQFNQYIPNMNNYIVNEKAFELESKVARFSAFYSDPNYYSIALILALVGILMLAARNHIKNSAVVYYLLIALFGAQTTSKSFILMFAIISVFFVFVLFKYKRYSTLLLASIVFIAIIAVGFKDGGIFENTIDRFIMADKNTGILTNRDTIWVKYLEHFSSDGFVLFVGNGVDAEFLGGAAHNTYIDFLYYYGLFGTAIFAITLFLSIKTSVNNRKRLLNYLPIACIMVNLFFVSSLYYYDFAYMLIVVAFLCKIDLNETEKEIPQALCRESIVGHNTVSRFHKEISI